MDLFVIITIQIGDMSSDLMISMKSKIQSSVSTCLHNNIQLLVERVS